MEKCLITDKTIQKGDEVFYIEAIGGYILGGKEEDLISFLKGQGWTEEEIEESRDDQDGEATIFFTTYD